jgi:hypothetical protein
MNGYRFPRTYADLDAAPWCHSYERPGNGDGFFIHIREAWLPADWGDPFSAYGETLWEALSDLTYYWHDMRPPADLDNSAS